MNENDLDEPLGTVMIPVDWNCDGQFDTGVAQDVNGGQNGWCGSSGSLGWVEDTNEWSIISDPRGDSDKGTCKEVGCITFEEWKVVQKDMVERRGCPQPVLAVESCFEGRNYFLGPFIAGVSNGTCDYPYFYLQQAHDNALDHSVFFLQPGTYNDTSVYGTVVLDRPGTYISNIGTARVE